MDWTSVRMHPRAHAAAEVVAHHIAEMTAGLNLNSSLMTDQKTAAIVTLWPSPT